jgi:hypothetical protein
MKFLQRITEDAKERQEKLEKNKDSKAKEKEEKSKSNDETTGLNIDRLNYEFEKIDDWKALEDAYEEASGQDDKSTVLNAFKKKIDIFERLIGANRKLSTAKVEIKYDILELVDDLKDAKETFSKLADDYKGKFGE